MCNFVLMFRMCLSCNAKKIQKLKDKRLEKMQVFQAILDHAFTSS